MVQVIYWSIARANSAYHIYSTDIPQMDRLGTAKLKAGVTGNDVIVHNVTTVNNYFKLLHLS